MLFHGADTINQTEIEVDKFRVGGQQCIEYPNVLPYDIHRLQHVKFHVREHVPRLNISKHQVINLVSSHHVLHCLIGLNMIDVRTNALPVESDDTINRVLPYVLFERFRQ
jgi:hypothetical protein